MCEYSRSRSFHYDLILQDQASGERSQDQWSSGIKMSKDHFYMVLSPQFVNYEVQSESSRTVLVVLFVFNEESQNFAY